MNNIWHIIALLVLWMILFGIVDYLTKGVISRTVYCHLDFIQDAQDEPWTRHSVYLFGFLVYRVEHRGRR